ncbi:MAG: PUA domain-containing protein, partial [Candidatus Woesearchaeota archaeon]
TYIRKLIHDIGKKIGCGAHMLELRRTKVGPFTEGNLYTLQDLSDAYYYYKNDKNEKFLRKILQPIENAVAHLPKVWIMDSTVNPLTHGMDLKIPGISKYHSNINKDDIVAMMTLKDELVALGIAMMTSDEIDKNEKGIAIKVEKVFMQSGIYK